MSGLYENHTRWRRQFCIGAYRCRLYPKAGGKTFFGSVGLRYGLTAKSEIYTRATLRYSQSRFTDTATGMVENLSDSSLQSVIVGMNYRFVDEGEYPGVIGFADIAIAENTAAQGTNFQSGKSGTIGFTAFRVLDPVVLSLTAGYRANAVRTVDGNQIDPGDTPFINPSIGFAVNNELTMTSGFVLDFTSADMRNGATIGTRNTNADLQFGLAYAWDKNTTLRADARSEVLGEGSFTAGITLTRKRAGLTLSDRRVRMNIIEENLPQRCWRLSALWPWYQRQLRRRG
ncbi:MAG: hypothetical protein U5N55_06675 [Cypionkella sp.]|nr:hypothetical protein [Cypionkella sp.]